MYQLDLIPSSSPSETLSTDCKNPFSKISLYKGFPSIKVVLNPEKIRQKSRTHNLLNYPDCVFVSISNRL